LPQNAPAIGQSLVEGLPQQSLSPLQTSKQTHDSNQKVEIDMCRLSEIHSAVARLFSDEYLRIQINPMLREQGWSAWYSLKTIQAHKF
jgi:hypothetical protein